MGKMAARALSPAFGLLRLLPGPTSPELGIRVTEKCINSRRGAAEVGGREREREIILRDRSSCREAGRFFRSCGLLARILMIRR
jgi:hypothetical protein